MKKAQGELEVPPAEARYLVQTMVQPGVEVIAGVQRDPDFGLFLLAGAGYVRDEDRDSIGQAADYLLRREGIETVLCYGIVNNQFVDGSLRTLSDVVDPDRFIKELLGNDPTGTPYGGGRADKGAFKIDLGIFARGEDKSLLWQLVRKTVEELFFNKIGINREDVTYSKIPQG